MYIYILDARRGGLKAPPSRAKPPSLRRSDAPMFRRSDVPRLRLQHPRVHGYSPRPPQSSCQQPQS